MTNFILGIIVGVILAETNSLPVIQEYILEVLKSFNQLKGE